MYRILIREEQIHFFLFAKICCQKWRKQAEKKSVTQRQPASTLTLSCMVLFLFLFITALFLRILRQHVRACMQRHRRRCFCVKESSMVSTAPAAHVLLCKRPHILSFAAHCYQRLYDRLLCSAHRHTAQILMHFVGSLTDLRIIRRILGGQRNHIAARLFGRAHRIQRILQHDTFLGRKL